MNQKSDSPKLSIEDVTDVLKKRFWVLTTILAVANILFAIFGKSLVDYKIRDYMEDKLKTYAADVELAKSNASAANTLANMAAPTAASASLLAEEAKKKAGDVDQQVEDLERKLGELTMQMATLSELDQRITIAKTTLGGYESLASRLGALEEGMNDIKGRTRYLRVDGKHSVFKGVLQVEDDTGTGQPGRLSLSNAGSESTVATDAPNGKFGSVIIINSKAK